MIQVTTMILVCLKLADMIECASRALYGAVQYLPRHEPELIRAKP